MIIIIVVINHTVMIMNDEFERLLKMFSSLFTVSESVTLTQTSPSCSPVCPEDDVVLTCQGTSNDTLLVFEASNGGTLQTVDSTNIINTNLNGIVLQWIGMNETYLTATATISNIPLNMNGVIISCSTSGVFGTFNMEKVNITGLIL